jgi:stage III sporulation protein SpoIIIAA
MDVSYLQSVTKPLLEMVSESDMEKLIQASVLRAQYAMANTGMRAICFDTVNHYSLASAEWIQTVRPHDGFFGEPLVVESDVDEVISVLPAYLQKRFFDTNPNDTATSKRQASIEEPPLADENVETSTPLLEEKLSDIVLDIGRRPQCWMEDRRLFLCDDVTTVVTQKEIQYISNKLKSFGTDNRAGLNDTIHRFSAIRNRDKDILGITIRIGRHVRGNAAMLMDVLMGSGDRSILFLGEPGSGKSTIVREASRILAEEKNVLVVDTSNEIAGDGVVPHHCIGLARRMMVPSLDAQSSVMVECVQNHTPHVMVIDEIGRPQEVQAARTVKQRGVRMIASAHGDLRKLLKNKDLCGLVGGVDQVVVGDDMARQEVHRKQSLAERLEGENRHFSVSKTKVQRRGEPTFEVIVEVRRGTLHEWRIVVDSATAVDRILDGFPYQAQRRIRNPQTGAMKMQFIDA